MSSDLTATGRAPADRLLRYPSATVVAYALLVALTVLSGVFIGEEVVLLTYPPSRWDSRSAGIVEWLVPTLLMVLSTCLTLRYPSWRERRGRWSPVPADTGRVAIERTAQLCAATGLPRTPQLMWQSAAADRPPFVYGRTGHHRLWISPQGLGAARRRPDRFDAVIRHELAHIANRDVFVGRFAVLSWYVTMAALALTPLLRVITRLEWRFLAEYAIRAVLLGLLLTLVRDRLLRLREHYADVRAAAWTGSGDSLVAVLSAGSSATPSRVGWRRVFSRHPEPGERVQVITDPSLLGRLSAVEFLSVGLLVGAGWPVVSRLVMATAGDWATSGVVVLVADGLARALLFGLLGMHAAVTLARAAAVGQLAHRALAAAAGSSVLGVVVGVVASPQQLGLLRDSRQIVATAVVTALLGAGFVIIFVADTARTLSARGAAPAPRSLAAVSAVCAALAALTVLPFSEAVASLHLNAVLWFETVSLGIFPLSLGLVLLGVSLWVSVRTRQLRPLLTGIGLGVGIGIVGTAVAAVVKLEAGHGLADDQLVALYYSLAAIAVVAAVAACTISSVLGRSGTLVGVLGGATATLVGTIGIYLTFNLLGGYMSAEEAPRLLHLVAGAAVLPALSLAAAGSLIRRRQAES